MKKKSFFLVFGLLISLAHQTAYAFSDNDFDDDDFFSVDTSLDTISTKDFTSHTNIQESSKSTFRSTDNVYLFFGILNGINANYPADVLNIPIYQQTSPVRNRPVLEEPWVLTYGFDTKDKNSVSLFLFFNYWSQKNYTLTGTTLSTYFDLGNPERIAAFTAIDKFATSLGLFDPATIEERRMGGVIEASVVHNKWNLIAQMPILYTEQNLSLKPWEKAAIQASSIGKMLETDNVSENDFVYEHIVMDQFGFGDLKFKAMYAMHNTQTFNLDLGGFIILPTATPIKQGLKGTWFDQNNTREYLNLGSIDITTTESKDAIANFFLGAVDKLSSNILNTPLGNGGFVVVAPSMNFDWYFARHWQFSNDFSLQIPLPTIQPRFYQYSQTKEQFQQAYDAAFAAGPEVFTSFVNQEVQNLFYPYEFPTRVFPGIVFNSTNQFLFEFRDWDFFFGNNFWYVGQETLTPPIFANSNNYSYDYKGAQAARAMQDKLFAKINCNLETLHYDWALSLYGDVTVWNSGIGNDYTVGFTVDCKF